MTLSFSTKIKGVETHFVDQIMEGLIANKLINEHQYNNCYNAYLDKGYTFTFLKEQKIHTIRRDDKNRWKAGNKIHFVINNRSKNRFQFAPVLEVKSVQAIEIGNLFGDRDHVTIDGVKLTNKQVEELASKDGFFSVNDFWNYFLNEDFYGSLIHWTNKKY